MDLYQVCVDDAPGVKIGPTTEGHTSWNIGTRNLIFEISFLWTGRHRALIFWCLASPCGPMPSLFIWCSWGQNWPCRGGHKLEHRNKENQLQNSSSLKLKGLELWYLVFSISLWTFINLFIWVLWSQNWPHLQGHKLEPKEQRCRMQ